MKFISTRGKFQQKVDAAYAIKCGLAADGGLFMPESIPALTGDELNSLMMRPDEMANDIGSVLDGRQAVDCGLIDEIGGLDRALEALHEMIDGQ